jgi:hypothetical protein
VHLTIKQKFLFIPLFIMKKVTKLKLVPILIRLSIKKALGNPLFLTIGVLRRNGAKKTVGFSRLFQLYRGYASNDRAQGSSQAKLTRELAQNSASPVYIGSTSESLRGNSAGDRGQLYRLRVIQGAAAGRTTRVRRSSSEVIVSYEQLSNQLQQINRQGGTVTSITLA